MTSTGRLSLDVKLAYGLGQAAEGIKTGAFGAFLLFYYNQVLGFSGSLAGLALGTSVVIDAIFDPVAGSVSDNWRSRLGRRHPFMFAAILPFAIGFYLLFNPPFRSELGLLLWLIVFSNLTRIAMSVFTVPHSALGAELTDDFAERSSVVAYRLFFGTFAGLAAIFIGFWFFFVPTPAFPNGQLNGAAYMPFAATLAVLMTIVMFVSAWGTRSAIAWLPTATARAPRSFGALLTSVFQDMIVAVRGGGFRWLFGGVLVVCIMSGVDGALGLYVSTYFWELTRRDILLLSAAYPLGSVVGSMLGPYLTNRYGKRWALLFGGFAWPFGQALPMVLRLIGWFPENGHPWLVPLLLVIRVIHGICTVQAAVAFGSMLADTADEHELNTGKRQQGIFFATSAFAAKASTGFGTIFAGLLLDLISWPRGAAIRTAADVPPETLSALGIVAGPVVGSIGLLSVWLYKHYKLTREQHAEILQELKHRRAAEILQPSPGEPPLAEPRAIAN